ncbi:transposase [Bacillus sp. DX1.1]|nr:MULTISPECIES: transposase [unclassified Bacillus (in: firmicutes)]MDM5154758.1 transposase [Bacillus sp. DX1.1]WJE84064.1 transposase [Bacillus sp. DX3.1]
MQRRKHSIEFKKQVVQEAIETGNKALVARRYDLSPNLVHKWIKAFQDHDRQEVGHHEVISPAEVKQLEAENDQLKKLLGEKNLEIAILRDVLKKKNSHLLKRLK